MFLHVLDFQENWLQNQVLIPAIIRPSSLRIPLDFCSFWLQDTESHTRSNYFILFTFLDTLVLWHYFGGSIFAVYVSRAINTMNTSLY